MQHKSIWCCRWQVFKCCWPPSRFSIYLLCSLSLLFLFIICSSSRQIHYSEILVFCQAAGDTEVVWSGDSVSLFFAGGGPKYKQIQSFWVAFIIKKQYQCPENTPKWPFLVINRLVLKRFSPETLIVPGRKFIVSIYLWQTSPNIINIVGQPPNYPN